LYHSTDPAVEDLPLIGKCIYEAKCLSTSLSSSELPTLLGDLNSVCDKWREIGIHLHVPLGELDKIHREGKNSNDQLRRTLEDWIQNDRKPTWFVLLDVLRRPVIGEESLAKSLQTKYCLDPVEPLIETDAQYQDAIYNHEDDFYALFQTLRHTVQSEDGGLPSLRMSIGAASDTKPEIMVLALPRIAKAKTVDEALLDLYLHCDFLNYGLLRHICEHVGNRECQQRMDSYVKQLENLKEFKLQVFMKVWRGIRRAPPCGTSKLVSKQIRNLDDYTINDALCVKGLICKKASVPPQLIRLESVHESDSASVSVVWLMPQSVANLLKENMSDQYTDEEFQQLAVDQLIIDDTIYNAVTDQVLVYQINGT